MFDCDIPSSILPGRAHGASLVAHGLFLLFLLALGLITPDLIVPARHPGPPVWLAAPEPEPTPVARPRLRRPREVPPKIAVLYAPPALIRRPRALTPPPQPTLRLEAPTATPPPEPVVVLAPPRPAVKTDVFAGIPTAAGPASRPYPALPVPVGGFSSVAAAEPARLARPSAHLGAFETTRASGSAGGTGARGPVNLGGWASTATGPAKPTKPAAALRSGGFGDSVAAAPSKPPPKPVAAAPSSAVEILSKPRPAYTAQARQFHLEGVVVLEVLFARTGQLQVLAVVRGLGYGLDENAVAAARAIRFRPAQQDGRPVDSVATVHITFQLAY